MASYATSTQLGQVGLRAAIIALLDAATVTAALDAATAWVNLRLRVRYPVPLTAPVDAWIVECVAVRAGWVLLSTNGFDPQNDSDKNLKERAAAVEKDLDKVAAGILHLELPSPGETASDTFVALMDPLSDDQRGW